MAAPVESPDLEAIVRDELRAPVTELVRRLIPQLVAEAEPCPACGEAGRPTDPGRRVCRRCRQQQHRERIARAREQPQPAGLPGPPAG